MNGAGRLDPGVATLAEVLTAAGYRTGAFVAAFVLDARFGLDRGFETYDDDLTGAVTRTVREPLSEYRPGNLVTDAALAWLARGSDRPFFCWVHLYDAHFPHFAHAELGGTRLGGVASYAAEVAFVDRQVGRLLEFLDTHRLSRRTLVVVVGDHGEGLGEHGEMEHGYLLNEEVMRVPLVLAWPGVVPEGQRVSTLVTLGDLVPTVLDLLAVPVPAPGRGRSLAPDLRGGPSRSPPLYGETDLPWTAFGWSPLRSVTTRRWRYVRTARPELYDRRRDPGERRNLAAAEAARVRKLDAVLTALERRMTAGRAARVVLSDDERRRLEALGYVEAAAPPAGAGGRPLRDVKDMRRVKALDAWLRARIQAGKLTQAEIEQVARRLVEESPGTAPFHHTLATALLAQGELDGAVTHLEEAVHLRPDFAEAESNLGQARLRQGRLGAARRHFGRALRLRRDLAEAHLGMGTVHAARGAPDAAARYYRRAIRARPDYADAHLNLANVLARAGATGEATEHYQEALRIQPDHAVAHHNFGLLLAEQDRVRAAIAHYREAVRLAPGLAVAHYNLGRVLAERGRLTEAIGSYREAIRVEPDNPEFLDNLAAAYAAAARPEDAAATAREAAARARAAGREKLAAEIEQRVPVYEEIGSRRMRARVRSAR